MFSVFLLVFVALGFGLSLFLIILLFVNPKKYQKSTNETTVVIVKFVELHRENLPLNSAHGWRLVSSHCSLRCWQKDISFNLLGTSVPVVACAKEIPCAAVILLNVIADVSTWSEWDVQASDQSFNLELPDNSSLHCDPYMQCDQLVLTTSKLKAKPDVKMYRFGNLESNGTGWILLWNAKQLDWTLFVAQPIDNFSVDANDEVEEKCLLTVIWGCEPVKDNMSEALCKKILSLSEAITWSQLKIRPFRSLINTSSTNNPHFPSIHTALNDLPRKPCVLLEHEERPMSFQNGALAVVSISSQKPGTLKSLLGFTLILFPFKKSNNNNITNFETEDKRRSRRRLKLRSDSMTSGVPRKKLLEIESRRSSSLTAPVRKKLPELTVTQADENGKPPQRAFSHSFLNVLFHQRRSSDSSFLRSRSASPCSPSKKKKKKHFFTFDKRSSLSSQEDLSSNPDLDFSDTNDERRLHSLRKAYDMEGESDFKALGEYSISAVLEENLRASLVDVNVSEEEQKKISGGWVCKEMNKRVAVFKKVTNFESCVFMSYLCKGIIPTSFEVVWKTLCNPLTRFMYDDTVKKITLLSEYPGGQKLIHMYNESVTLLKKEVQDFLVLQTEKKQGSQFILGFHSVKDDICPPANNIVRGTIVASGWVVEPVSNSTASCQVSYLVQMIVGSPEVNSMEDISNMQSQCINNLSLYLSSKPPSYLSA